MRKLFVLAGVLVAAAAGVIFYRRSRRPLAAAPDATPEPFPAMDPDLVITDADLVELPAMGISAVDPEPITQIAGEGIDLDAAPRR